MKTLKYGIIIIGMIITFLLMTAIPSLATTATVTTDTLKIRKGPSTDTSTLELLSQNDKIEVLGKEGEWYQIKYKGITGYVKQDYIKVEKEEEQLPKEEQQEEEQPQESVNTSKDPTTNMIGTKITTKQKYIAKILPLVHAPTLGEIASGEEITVISQTGKWIYLQMDEIAGWIYYEQEVQTNTTPVEPKEETNKEEDTTIKTGYVSEPSVYVRKEPSTDSEIVTSLITNAEVDIIGESGDWYKIKINGETAYIAKRLISNSPKETTSRGDVERETKAVEEPKTENEVSKGEEIANFAKQYLGNTYVYAASGPTTFDCSGFTLFVYKKFGIALSHSATAQSYQGTPIEKQDIQIGDLVVFRDEDNKETGHAGIYIGNGEFIHASSAVGRVTITPLSKQYYSDRFVTARRFI